MIRLRFRSSAIFMALYLSTLGLDAKESYTLDASLYGGYCAIQSQEKVLSPSRSKEFSRLNWTANNVWILGGTGTLFFPSNLVHLTLDGWSRVYSSNGNMVDRDYLDEFDPYKLTDISKHPRTKLKTAFAIDFEVGKDFKYSSSWSYGYLLGFKYVRFDWEVFGGEIFYDNGTVYERLPSSLKVIRYSQMLSVPYLGGEVIWACKPQWKIRAFGKYSGLAYLECHDDHLSWPRYFTSKHRFANYWMAGVDLFWRYSKKLSANIKYSYDHLNQAIGNTTVKDGDEIFQYPKASGVKFSFQKVTVGVDYLF